MSPLLLKIQANIASIRLSQKRLLKGAKNRISRCSPSRPDLTIPNSDQRSLHSDRHKSCPYNKNRLDAEVLISGGKPLPP
jgi:hypothetical protein